MFAAKIRIADEHYVRRKKESASTSQETDSLRPKNIIITIERHSICQTEIL